MAADALDTEYENGVADVLAYLAGNAATVERNVRIPGKKSGRLRQIDVKVIGALFGSVNATMVVDCKRYTKPLDVNHVGTFVGLVDDVAADIGLLVSTVGISPAAQQYADNVRGIRLNILSIDSLAAWSPRGTANFNYAVPKEVYPEAVRAVRRAGFRVRTIEVDEDRGRHAWPPLVGSHSGGHPGRYDFGVLRGGDHRGTGPPNGDLSNRGAPRAVERHPS